jgi:spore maturation protein CgeB
MQRRKVLLIGERSLDSKGYAYADSFYDILKDQGHIVLSVDGTCVDDVFGRKRRGDLTRLERIFFDYRFNIKLIKIAQKFLPDVCFVLKGDTIKPSTITKIKNITSSKWILFYPDNPFMFLNGNSNADVVRGLSLYDVVLSWAEMLIPIFISLGVRHVCYFPFGYDNRFFSNFEEVEKRCDVGFVGTADDERVEVLVNFLTKHPSVSFGIWGNRWDEYFFRFPILQKKYHGPAVYGKDMVRLLRSCSIVLNPVRLQNYTSHNMRSLEIPAAGAFQLATYTQEHARKLFSEDVSIALYKDFDELSIKIVWYLAHPDERKKIIDKSFEEVQKYSLQVVLQSFFENDLCFCSTLLSVRDSLCVRSSV